jgi:hypothetical protein
MMREKYRVRRQCGARGEGDVEERRELEPRTRTGSGAVRSRSKKDWDPKRIRT